MASTLEKIISQEFGSTNFASEIKTTTISLHVSQMCEWGIRGGSIEIKAIQDENGIRKNFIKKIIEANRIKKRLEAVMTGLTCRGEILWLVKQSSEKKYCVDFYVGGKYNPDPEYEVFYKNDFLEKDAIECVILIDEVENNSSYGSAYQLGVKGGKRKSFYISRIDRDRTFTIRLEYKPPNLRAMYSLFKAEGQDFIVSNNVFEGEFPFVVCKNYEQSINESGIDDFTPHQGLIEEHNQLLCDASDNLHIYNTPTLVTSRDAAVVVESVNNSNIISGNTWANNNGFRSSFTPASNRPFKMPRVFGSVREGERFGYVQSPDAVSGDQNLYIRQTRELIHWILGGVDPLGISSSATFGEIKSLFGRIENTASKKAKIILDSFCELISLILKKEETSCKIAITKLLLEVEGIEQSVSNHLLTDYDFKNLYAFYKQSGVTIPGLPPLGDSKCSWKYTKRVFQNTTREKLDESIIYRNEREDGITQEVALARLYPDMSDDEIRQMMSGFSPRVVQTDLAGIQGVLQLHSTLMTVPDPENNELPWAIRLGTKNLVDQAIATLQKELEYNIPNFKESDSEVEKEVNLLLTKLLNDASVQSTNSTQSSRASYSIN